MTGLNAINMYSSIMIKKLNSSCDSNPDDCFPLTPTAGTYFVGVFGFIGALMGPFIIGNMKRKNNLLYGHGTMGVTMILMAIFKILSLNMLLFVCICIYAILYQTSLGAAIWMYSNEVTVDSAGGLIVIGCFGMIFIQSLCL